MTKIPSFWNSIASNFSPFSRSHVSRYCSHPGLCLTALIAIPGTLLGQSFTEISAGAEASLPESESPYYYQEDEFAGTQTSGADTYYFPTEAEVLSPYSGTRRFQPGVDEVFAQESNQRYGEERTFWNEPFDGVGAYSGLLDPRQTSFWAGEDPFSNQRFILGGGVSNIFAPDYKARGILFKAGPFYLDLLSTSFTALYADLNSSAPGRSESGWIGVGEVHLRLISRISRDFVIGGDLRFFVTSNGDVGFFGPVQGPALLLAWEREVGDWRYVIYNEVNFRQNFKGLFDEASESIGRYTLGLNLDDSRASDVFEGENSTLVNQFGVSAMGPVGADTLLSTGVQREDRIALDGRDNRDIHRFFARLDHRPEGWTVTPYLENLLAAYDEFSLIRNRFFVGLIGQFGQNIRWDAKVGYGYTWDDQTRRDRHNMLFEASMNHRLAQRTWYDISAGRNYFEDLTGDPFEALFVRAYLRHGLTDTLSVFGSGRIYSADDSRVGTASRDRVTYEVSAGATLQLTHSTWLRGAFIYIDDDYSTPGFDRTRYIYQVRLRQNITESIHATLLYQFEQSDSPLMRNDYDEHLFIARLTKVF